MSVNNPGANCHLPDLLDLCRRVPRLHAYTADGGRVYLVLDGRLGLELSEAEACAVVPFIADCVDAALEWRANADPGQHVMGNPPNAGDEP